MSEKRDAIPDDLPRQAGQSTTDIINEFVFDKFLPIFIILVSILMFGNGYLIGLGLNPLIYFFISIASSILSLIVFYCWLKKKEKEINYYKSGRKGEIFVAMYLAEYKPKDFYVVHDLVDRNYNIDHVIICKHGVFTIETKNWSKPDKGDITTKVFEEHIETYDGTINKEVIIQCKAQRKSIKELIKNNIGQDIEITPLLVIVNGFVKNIDDNQPVLGFNQKQIIGHIQKQPEVLDEKTVQYIYAQLLKN